MHRDRTSTDDFQGLEVGGKRENLFNKVRALFYLGVMKMFCNYIEVVVGGCTTL